MNTFCRTTAKLARKGLLITCLPVAFAFSHSAHAENGEDIFKRAPLYTVQIRTTVDMPFSGDYRSSSMGAGFVVDAERGWVMTNAHVAAHSPSQIRVRFQGGDYAEATKVYVDPYLDLAVLELDAVATQRPRGCDARLRGFSIYWSPCRRFRASVEPCVHGYTRHHFRCDLAHGHRAAPDRRANQRWKLGWPAHQLGKWQDRRTQHFEHQ